MSNDCITTGSHFSGYGSYLFALDSLGVKYKSLFACDIDKYAKQTYQANHNTEQFFDDVTAVEVQDASTVDLFITSPPCQSFSMAGKRGGTNDARGTLFFHSLEYIKNKRPRFFIFENVKGLISSEGGSTFKSWLQMLGKDVNGGGIQQDLFKDVVTRSAGYYIRWAVLNSKEVGFPEPVPQNRERVFIVGFRDLKDYKSFKMPKKSKLNKNLSQMLDKDGFEKFIMSKSFTNRLIKRKEKGHSFGVNIGNKIACCLCSLHYVKNSSDANYVPIKNNTKKGFINAYPGDFVLLAFASNDKKRGRVKKGYSGTVNTTADMGVVTKNLKIRKLTPNECRKLMGLPDTFIQPNSNSQAYKQYGNSIVVNTLAAIINNIPL